MNDVQAPFCEVCHTVAHLRELHGVKLCPKCYLEYRSKEMCPSPYMVPSPALPMPWCGPNNSGGLQY